jgi:putative acetyltransferase
VRLEPDEGKLSRPVLRGLGRSNPARLPDRHRWLVMRASTEFSIRTAALTDAESLATMWVRSIRELCRRDHQGREDLIATWCAQKTPAALRAILTDPTLFWLVAVDGTGSVRGLGLLGPGGLIQAIYVDPSWVRRGIGSVLLAGLEAEIGRRGQGEAVLESTATARAFYRRQGFEDTAAPILRFGGIAAYPMRKALGSTVVPAPDGA